MSRKKKTTGGPVPPGNRPPGPGGDRAEDQPAVPPAGAPLSEQDEKRRLGNYQTTGEHAFVQPGGKNDANH